MAYSDWCGQGRKRAESRVKSAQFYFIRGTGGSFAVISRKTNTLRTAQKSSWASRSSTVGDVLRALNWQKTEEIGLSIYGRRCKEEALLKDGDRIELTEPLRIDPKEARRLRALNKPLLATRGRKHQNKISPFE